MQVSNPNKEKKTKSSHSLLGFFYNHTKGIVKTFLFVSVITLFVTSFLKKMETYELMRFMMNPLEIMFWGAIEAIHREIMVFIPFLFVCLIVKYFMVKSRKVKVERVFDKTFKLEIALSFVLSLILAILFYADILNVMKFTPRLVKSSVEIFVLLFASILFSLTSMYGVVKGVETVLLKKDK